MFFSVRLQHIPKYRSFSKNVEGVEYLYVLSGKAVTFIGQVLAVNDLPIANSFRAYFPPIAFNLTVNPNLGFLVSDVLNKPAVPFGIRIPKYSQPSPLATDVEGDVMGIAVAQAPNSSIGLWYYKLGGASNWSELVVENNFTGGRLSGNKSVFLIPHNTRLVLILSFDIESFMVKLCLSKFLLEGYLILCS